METQDNQVAIIEKSLDVLKTGPAILQANQLRGSKAVAVGNNILALIIRNGMTPELDERASKYLVNCATAVKEMKEDRAGVTQIMDELKSMFTSVENSLDIKKEGTPAARLQGERNRYAKQVADEQKRKRDEAEREAAKAREAVDIKYQMSNNYTSQYNNFLLGRKQKMQNGFNTISLDNYTERCELLKNKTFEFDFKHEGPYSSAFKLHTNDELYVIADAVVKEQYESLKANYLAEMNLMKDDLVDKLSSKLAELTEQKRIADEQEEARQQELERQKAAKTEAEKKASIERIAKLGREADEKNKEAADNQKRREQEEEQRLLRESEEANKKAEQAAEVAKQGEQTMILFEKEAAIAEVAPAPEARQGYEIIVLHPAGYAQIFQFWFEKEGNKLGIDQIGKKTLDSMKTFCEKYAHKHNEKIESKLLRYEETHKAVNRREAVK